MIRESPSGATVGKAPDGEMLPGAFDVEWCWRAFGELTLEELYAALRLRQRVFVVEQQCPYLDLDDADKYAWHLMGMTREADSQLVAYARVFRPGIRYAEASIGRVITDSRARRTGLGKKLMAEAVRRAGEVAPQTPIRIGAQIHLEQFYEGFGFRRASEPYEEDGIIHIEMLRPVP